MPRFTLSRRSFLRGLFQCTGGYAATVAGQLACESLCGFLRGFGRYA